MHEKLIRGQIDREVDQLSEAQQLRVLEFVRSLRNGTPRGESGADLVARLPKFPAEDLREIEQAIEDGCEQVDPDGW